ncbi:MAG: TetR/AcrR family transcriptional regulator [Campylobacteraceae bacterium]|nr:TetR/AcrR family transcriptional regulator [Campylobacteraceae bacterium]
MTTVKEQLIKIATNTVQKSGINALTMRELGDAVGIKSSSVMYHFKSKDGLICELVNSYSEGFTLYLEELSNTYNDPKTRLLKFVDIFEEVLKDGKFCLCGMLASQNENLDDLTRDKTRSFFTASEIWVSQALNDEQNEAYLAKVIISSLEGAMLLDKLDEKTQRLDAVRAWLKTLFQ